MDYVDALDKLIDAYRKIADSLPSLDRLSSALKDNHDFQVVLADLYGDILEFHRYASNRGTGETRERSTCCATALCYDMAESI